MLSIGIIDSGVPDPVPESLMEASSFVYDGREVRQLWDQAIDQIGHGSAITRIIATGVKEVSLYSARVFTDTLLTRPVQVAAALEWLLEQEVRIINMSFGLPQDRIALRRVCDRALDRGVILVASAPARGKPVYPAAYPGVIRVCGDARCGPEEISWINNGQVDFGAHARSDSAAIAGASVAAARVTAAMAVMLATAPAAWGTELISRLGESAAYVGREYR